MSALNVVIISVGEMIALCEDTPYQRHKLIPAIMTTGIFLLLVSVSDYVRTY